MNQLYELIASNEDWLMGRVLYYAKERGYVKYTSTLEEAWRLSIAGLSKPLLELLKEGNLIFELGPDENLNLKLITSFGIIEAGKHRARGIDLGLFLGLMKYYRRSYLDLIRQAGFEPDFEEKSLNFIDGYFDHLEISFCNEWGKKTKDQVVTELQSYNREMTNEKNRYLTIFESLANPVILFNAKNQIIDINHGATELFEKHKLPGANYYSKQPGEGVLFWLAEELSTFAGTKDIQLIFEKELLTQEGIRYFEVKFTSMLDVSEKFNGTIVILHDITEQKQMREQLKQQKQFAENLVQNSVVPTFVLDSQHKVIIWNKACEELTGLKAKQVLGTSNHWQAFYQHKRPCLSDMIIDGKFADLSSLYSIYVKSELISDGLRGEGWFDNLGGGMRYLIFDTAPIYDSEGQLIAVIETLQDITEGKLAEKALQESEEKLRATFDQAAVGIVHANIDGRWIFVNQKFCDIIGYPIEETKDLKFRDITYFEDIEADNENVRRLLAGEFQTFSMEKRYIRKDGSLVWVNLTASLVRKADGAPRHFIGIIEDITSRKLVEEELRNTKERLESFINNTADAIFITDLQSNILQANQAFESIFGWTAQEVLGKKTPTVREDQLDEVAEIINKVQAGEQVASYIAVRQRKDGSLVHVSMSLGPIRDVTGNVVAVAAIARDISGMIEAEKALQEKNRMMELELELAAKVQRDLLPQELPELSGATVAWEFRPSIFASGDMFNIFQLDDSHIGFYILDVMGHGIPTALKAVSLSYFLKPSPYIDSYLSPKSSDKADKIISPSEILKLLNEHFADKSRGNEFFTIFYGVLNTQTLQLTYARAGHCPPMVIQPDGNTHDLRQGGPAMGLAKNIIYKDYTISLSPGDKLILYTDGITEARNQENKLFSKECLRHLLVQRREMKIDQLIDLAVQRVIEYAGSSKPDDDITILGLEINHKEENLADYYNYGGI